MDDEVVLWFWWAALFGIVVYLLRGKKQQTTAAGDDNPSKPSEIVHRRRSGSSIPTPSEGDGSTIPSAVPRNNLTHRNVNRNVVERCNPSSLRVNGESVPPG
jgi:hypothetical protein